MNKLLRIVVASAALALAATPSWGRERIILLNEGGWQNDNGRITYFDDGEIVSNQWFRDVNGTKLGDTPNDIIGVKPDVIAISVNWSNIIQFIDTKGKAIGATEDVPNNRKLATDGQYVYVTSYGHECATATGLKTFTKGFVAKIDASTYKVVDAVEVGYEPEGIAYYEGKLFVANSGGYAFQENHDYEKTVNIIDAATMKVERTIDTGQINLYGKVTQSGQYICINSPGDYYQVAAATIIMDCQAALDGKADAQCLAKLPFASTNSTATTDGKIFAIGSSYSYTTGAYEFNYLTIDPAEVMQTGGTKGVYRNTLPGTMVDDIKKMAQPYDIYVNPYSGYIYATDAQGFVESGAMYQWDPAGKLLGKHKTYINPAHFLALTEDGHAGVGSISTDIVDDPNAPMYNLQGIRIEHPIPGQIYIQNGKKILYRE